MNEQKLTLRACDAGEWLTKAISAYAPPGSRSMPANPRPPGTIVPSGCTAAVLRVLMDQREGVWLSRWQIVALTGRADKAVDSAILFLRGLGRIEAAPDAQRNPRYLRYRVAQHAKQPESV